jgi:hypothetical protein
MTRSLAIAAVGLALAGCTKENVQGRVSFMLYGSGGSPDAGEAPQLVAAAAIVSAEASIYEPDGIYVRAQSMLESGVTTVLELDLAPGRAPVVSYSEWSHGVRRFDGTAAGGKVLVDRARRTRGRFALRFTDPGPDGVAGTSDDAVRLVTDGQWYVAPAPAAPSDPPVDVGPSGGGQVDVEVWDWPDAAPVDLSTGSAGTGPGASSGDGDGSGGCGGDTADADLSGCGGDSGGCDGDTGGGSSADVSGCDGDTGGADLSGCDGDTGGADLSGCAGDLRSKAAKKRAGQARGATRFGPLFALVFVQALSRPRRRSRGPAQSMEWRDLFR